jgi:hypothetical protein
MIVVAKVSKKQRTVFIRRGSSSRNYMRYRFTVFENLESQVDISRARKLRVLETISKFQPKRVGYYELKKHEPKFEEGCSKSLDERQQAKLKWL